MYKNTHTDTHMHAQTHAHACRRVHTPTHTALAWLPRCVFISVWCHVSKAAVSPEASRKEAKAAAAVFLMRSSFKRSIQTSESTETDQREETGIKQPHLSSAGHSPVQQQQQQQQPILLTRRSLSWDRMWTWRSFLCVSLVSGLALDSNTIRSSKETLPHSSELTVVLLLLLHTVQ